MSEKKADKKDERSFPSSFGRYLLLDRLAAGGMAEVFRARSANDGNRLIAIKCMLAALADDEEFAGMFVDEAKLAAQLSHPNIVQIYELGRHKEQLYIAMELIHGKDLRGIVRKAKKRNFVLPKQFVAYVVAKTAEALDYAHRKTSIDGKPLKLVHRDISPQNILVGYDGEVKVVDFGIAKADQRRTVSRVGILKGKFAYMAPEQVKTGDVDGRTDLFALGAVLFETFAGRKLFYGESDFSILENVTNGKLPESPELWDRIPQEIAPVVKRAVMVDPAARYQEGSHLSEALEPVLISDRTFFGPKQAREVMQSLFAEEIAENEHVLRSFAHLTGEDVFHMRRPSQRIEPVDRRDWSIVTRDPVHAREEAEREVAAHREKERQRHENTASRGATDEHPDTATARDGATRRKTGEPEPRRERRDAPEPGSRVDATDQLPRTRRRDSQQLSSGADSTDQLPRAAAGRRDSQQLSGRVDSTEQAARDGAGRRESPEASSRIDATDQRDGARRRDSQQLDDRRDATALAARDGGGRRASQDGGVPADATDQVPRDGARRRDSQQLDRRDATALARRNSERFAGTDELADDEPEEETRLMDAGTAIALEAAKSASKPAPRAAATVELAETKTDDAPTNEPKPYLLWGVSGAFAFGLLLLVVIAIVQASRDDKPTAPVGTTQQHDAGVAVQAASDAARNNAAQGGASPLQKTGGAPSMPPLEQTGANPAQTSAPSLGQTGGPAVADAPAPPSLASAADVEEAVTEVSDDEADKAPRFGFVSVRTSDGRPATISIDKKDLGAAPVVKRRLPIGEHIVRVVDARSRVRVLQVNVTARNTRNKPLDLVVTP